MFICHKYDIAWPRRCCCDPSTGIVCPWVGSASPWPAHRRRRRRSSSCPWAYIACPWVGIVCPSNGSASPSTRRFRHLRSIRPRRLAIVCPLDGSASRWSSTRPSLARLSRRSSISTHLCCPIAFLARFLAAFLRLPLICFWEFTFSIGWF